MNPRFRIWLKSIGLTPEDYEAARKKADGNPTVLVINGLSEFVIPAYIRWSDAQWTEWANQLGFQNGPSGIMAHHNAVLAGHSHADHHRWLAAKYGVTDAPYEPSLSPNADFR